MPISARCPNSLASPRQDLPPHRATTARSLRRRPSSGRRGRLLHGLFDPLHVDLPRAGAELLEDLKHHGPSIICHLGGAPFNQTAVKFTGSAADHELVPLHGSFELQFDIRGATLASEMIFTPARETSISLPQEPHLRRRSAERQPTDPMFSRTSPRGDVHASAKSANSRCIGALVETRAQREWPRRAFDHPKATPSITECSTPAFQCRWSPIWSS